MDGQVEVEFALATAETCWKVASIFVFIFGIYVMWLCDKTPRRRIVSPCFPGMVIAIYGPVIAGAIAYICLRIHFAQSDLVPACRLTGYSKLSFNPVSWACNLERLSEWAASTAENGLTMESLLLLPNIKIIAELIVSAGVIAISMLGNVSQLRQLVEAKLQKSIGKDEELSAGLGQTI